MSCCASHSCMDKLEVETLKLISRSSNNFLADPAKLLRSGSLSQHADLRCLLPLEHTI